MSDTWIYIFLLVFRFICVGFRYRMIFLEKYRPQKKGKTVCNVRVVVRALNDSVYRHNCNTFSSLNEQDFLESVLSHGRKLLLSTLLCRNREIGITGITDAASETGKPGNIVEIAKAPVPRRFALFHILLNPPPNSSPTITINSQVWLNPPNSTAIIDSLRFQTAPLSFSLTHLL